MGAQSEPERHGSSGPGVIWGALQGALCRTPTRSQEEGAWVPSTSPTPGVAWYGEELAPGSGSKPQQGGVSGVDSHAHTLTHKCCELSHTSLRVDAYFCFSWVNKQLGVERLDHVIGICLTF